MDFFSIFNRFLSNLPLNPHTLLAPMKTRNNEFHNLTLMIFRAIPFVYLETSLSHVKRQQIFSSHTPPPFPRHAIHSCFFKKTIKSSSGIYFPD